MVDNMVVGGPAYNCGKLEKGDAIIEVDLTPVTIDDIHRALLGNDIPGSSVTVTVRKTSGTITSIVLKRIATEAIADRRRMFEMFTTLKDRAIVDSDGFAAETIDDCIQLWTKMLIADEVHDRKIVENVQIMQKESLELIRVLTSQVEKLNCEESHVRERAVAPPIDDGLLIDLQNKYDTDMARMQKLLDGMVPQPLYAASQDNLKQCELELDRLRKLLEATVPKTEFDSKCDEVNSMMGEIRRFQAEIERMKSALERLQTLQDELDALRKELEQALKSRDELAALKSAMESMVPQSKYDASQDSLKLRELELDRLRKLLEATVPKVRFDAKCDEANELSEEIKRLQAEIERQKSSLDRLNGVVEELNNLKKTREEMLALRSALESMVPKPKFDSSQDSLKRCELELDRLRKMLDSTVPKVHLDVKSDEALNLAGEVKRLQAEIERQKVALDRLAGMQEELNMMRNDLEEGIKAKDELAALKSQVEKMVLKTKYDSLQDDLKLRDLELDRLRKMLEGTVPKVRYTSKCDEATESLEEIKRLQAEIERMKGALERLKTLQDELNSVRKELEEARKARDELAALKSAMESMVPQSKYDASQDSLKLRELELDRLRKLLEATVPKVRFDVKCDESNGLSEEIQRLQAEIERQKSSLERLKTMQEDLTNMHKRLLESQIDCKAKTTELDVKSQDVLRLEAQVSSMMAKLASMISKEDLDFALQDARNVRKELLSLKNLLAGAGLTDTDVLEVFLSHLQGLDLLLLQSLFDKLKGSPRINMSELCALLDLLSGPSAIQLSELIGLLKDLEGPPYRSCTELRQLLKICNEAEPLTAEDLSALRKILRGPPAISLSMLQDLLRECSDPNQLRRLRAEFAALLKQIAVLESEVSSLRVPSSPLFSAPFNTTFSGRLSIMLISSVPDVTIYYTLDGSLPKPENCDSSGPSPLEVVVQDSCVVTAVSINGKGFVSPAVAERFKAESVREPRERARPSQERRLGGTGMLIQRFQDANQGEWHVKVKTLVPGGSAEASGQIMPGDLLLSVDGQEVKGKTTEMILQMISGFEDSIVELKLMRISESILAYNEDMHHVTHDGGIVYTVELRRSCAGFNHDTFPTSPRQPAAKISPVPAIFNPFTSNS